VSTEQEPKAQPENPDELTEPTKFIYKTTVYGNEHGQRVMHREVVYGEGPDDWADFVGFADLNVDVSDITGQAGMKVQKAYDVGIPARTIKEAFDKLSEAAAEVAPDIAAKVRTEARARVEAVDQRDEARAVPARQLGEHRGRPAAVEERDEPIGMRHGASLFPP